MSQELLIELYKKQANIIYGFLLKNGCTKEDAEDIIHDSFVKTIQYLDGVNPNKLSSWLFKVALNNFKNKIRRKGKVLHLDIDEQIFADRLIAEEGPVDTILKDEQINQVKFCLSELNETFRNLLILKYDLGLTYNEICMLLGLSENVLKTYLYRARKEFRKKWEAEYERK